MDCATLKERIGARPAGEPLVVDAALHESEPIASMLAAVLGEVPLRVAGAAVRDVPGGLEVAGKAAVLGLPDAAVECLFVEEAGTLQLRAKVRLPKSWLFGLTFPTLLQQGGKWEKAIGAMPFDQPCFVLASAQYQDSEFEVPCEPGLNFTGLLEDALQAVRMFTRADAPQRVHGTCTPGAGGAEPRLNAPTIRLQAPVPGQREVGPVELEDIVVRFFPCEGEIPKIDEAIEHAFHAEAKAKLAGEPATVRAYLPAETKKPLLVVGTFEHADLPTLSSLADFVGGKDSLSILPKDLEKDFPLRLDSLLWQLTPAEDDQPAEQKTRAAGLAQKPWNVVKDVLVVEELNLQVDWKTGEKATLGVNGRLRLGGGTFEVTGRLPEPTLTAKLVEGAVAVHEVAAHFEPKLAALPHVTVSAFDLTADWKEKTCKGSAALSDRWALAFKAGGGSGELALENTTVAFDYVAKPKKVDVKVSGQLTIDETRFAVTVAVPAKKQPWSLTTETVGEDQISLNGILKTLLCGAVKVPDSLLDVRLVKTKLELALKGEDRKLDVLKLSSSVANKLHLKPAALEGAPSVDLDELAVALDIQKGDTKSATLKLTGKLVVAGVRFDVASDIDLDGKTWDLTAKTVEKDRFNLGDVVRGLLPDAPPLRRGVPDVHLQHGVLDLKKIGAEGGFESLVLSTDVVDTKVSLGTTADYAPKSVKVEIRKEKDKAAGSVEVVGRLQVRGYVDVGGRLVVDEKSARFFPDEPSKFDVPIPIPMRRSGDSVLEVSLGPVTFIWAGDEDAEGKDAAKKDGAKKESALSLAASVRLDFTKIDAPPLVKKVLPDSITGTLYVDSKKLDVAVTRLAKPVEIDLPTLEIGGGKCPLGKAYVDLRNLHLTRAETTELVGQVLIGLPESVNCVFGADGGTPKHRPFKTYSASDVENTTVQVNVKNTLGAAKGQDNGLSWQFVTLPIDGVSLEREGAEEVQEQMRGELYAPDGVPTGPVPERLPIPWYGDWKRWLNLDLTLPEIGDFGDIKVSLPDFHLDLNGQFSASGTIWITDLMFPLLPLLQLLQEAHLEKLAERMPKGVPLRDVHLLDGDKLSAKKLREHVGSKFPTDLEPVIEKVAPFTKKLPARLLEYFDFHIPTKFDYDIFLTTQGDCRFNVKTNKEDPPPDGWLAKVLTVQGPMLVGYRVKKFATGEILKGQLATLEVDGEMDVFDLPSLAAIVVLPEKIAGEGGPLPSGRDTHLVFKAQNLFCVLPAGSPIPVPVFWDELSVERLGIEGFRFGSHFRNPMPKLPWIEVIRLLSDLVRFFLDREAELDPKNPPANADFKFTVGEQYVELPKYLGAKVVGAKDHDVATWSAYSQIAPVLNSVKKVRVLDLLRLIPLEKRHGEHELKFGPASVKADWLATTKSEFDGLASAPGGWEKKKARAGRVLESAVKALPSGEKKPDDDFRVLLDGKWDMGGVGMSATFGALMAGAGEFPGVGRFATGFLLDGKVGGKVADVEVLGRCVVDPEEKDQGVFRGVGEVRLNVVGSEIFKADAELSEDQFKFSGKVNLFPKNPLLKATGDVSGLISGKKIEIDGEVSTELAGLKLTGAKLHLDNDELTVQGEYLGQKVTLKASVENNELILTGRLELVLDLDVALGTIKKALGRVADSLSFPLKAKATLGLRVGGGKVQVSISAGADLNGTKLEFGPFTLTIAPKDIAEVSASIVKEVIKDPVKLFDAIFLSVEAWAKLVKSIIPPSDSSLIDWVEGAKFSFANPLGEIFEAIGDGLKKGFQLAEAGAAKVLRAIDATAEETVKVLQNVYAAGTETIVGALKDAGYACTEIAKATAGLFKDMEHALGVLGKVGFPALDISKMTSVLLKSLKFPFKVPKLKIKLKLGFGKGKGAKSINTQPAGKAQARLGDRAVAAGDSHGCPACPHPAFGPAVNGSTNVFVNKMPAIRVGDPGIHAACCGPNQWSAKSGSSTVYINGKPAHRAGDETKHCGGKGQMIQGSFNVFVG